MSCCGKKRSAWNESRESSPRRNRPRDHQARESIEDDIVFEYTGMHPQIFRGAVSGANYQFRFRGDSLPVAYPDSFAMMAERDLRKR